LRGWKNQSAFDAKEGRPLEYKFRIPVDKWFGAPFRTLVAQVFSLFGRRLKVERLALIAGDPIPPEEPSKDADEFLLHISPGYR